MLLNSSIRLQDFQGLYIKNEIYLSHLTNQLFFSQEIEWRFNFWPFNLTHVIFHLNGIL